MKKETLLELILGTIGGLVFAIGMCMCLIPEWDLFKAGVVIAILGFIVLLCIIPVYRKNHPKKEHTPINWGIVFTWLIGIVGALVMGFGMSKVMVGDGARWFKERGLWEGNGYIPKSGDLIFFDWDGDKKLNHVGIVERVENNYIYVIEGNSNNKCVRNKYFINSNEIAGFGVLNFYA